VPYPAGNPPDYVVHYINNLDAINMQFCTFFLNNIYFGIDVLQVQEIIGFAELTRIPLAPEDILGLINLRGQIVTIIDIKRRLEMRSNPNMKDFTNQDRNNSDFNLYNSYNIILRFNSELVSLLVDEVGDVIEVAESDFESPPASLKGKMRKVLHGAYKLKDKFLLVLDTEKLLTTT
jgi:purine-binding chemotaxis protein CheW